MATNQILNIDDQLVTPSHPARDDGAMDYARCAKLHNYLVEYGWVGAGHSLNDLPRLTILEHWGDEADELRDHLSADVASFLDLAIAPSVTFYFWVDDMWAPSDMLAEEETGLFDVDFADRFLKLYSTNAGICGHIVGLVYDQRRHRATMAMGIEDVGFSVPVEEHEDLWFPLEAVLSNWIDLTRIGKITTSPEEEDEDVGGADIEETQDLSPSENENMGPWTWHSYSAAQVDTAVAAFHRLADAIEERMPAEGLLPMRERSLLTEAELDRASVPQQCFIRSFLTRVRTPRFKAIAPGLRVPHDAAAFAASQKFTTVAANDGDGNGTVIAPVLVFAATEGRTANFDVPPDSFFSPNPFCSIFSESINQGDHSTPAGLYSESVERYSFDNAEEGFRLILPFPVPPSARKSSGAKINSEDEGGGANIADLFQHGFKPFGGEPGRAQRLERLLDRMRALVEGGLWSVGREGVEGSIELFRSENAVHEYWIEPTW